MTQTLKIAGRAHMTLSLARVVLLCGVIAACDAPSAPEVATREVFAAVAGVIPYAQTNALRSSEAVSRMRYGVNGHPAAGYFPSVPAVAQVDGLRRLAGTMYRADVVVDDETFSVINLQALRDAINAAAAAGMQTVLVLSDERFERNSAEYRSFFADTIAVRNYATQYAQSVIASVVSPFAGWGIAAVELGNELDVATIPSAGLVGRYASDYDSALLPGARALYQGMRTAFATHPSSAISSLPRLLNSSQGHTYWPSAARLTTTQRWVFRNRRWVLETVRDSILISANTTDQISWHWYRDLNRSFDRISTPFWQPAQPSVLSQLRGQFSGGFRLWITEFGREVPDSRQVLGACPHDEFASASVADLPILLEDFALQPEIQVALAYELFDQMNASTDVQARYGLATYACPSTGQQIVVKDAGDAFTRTVHSLRDERRALAHAALEVLADSAVLFASDSALAEHAVSNASSRSAVRQLVDNAIARNRWVESIYRRILRREASGSELGYWTGAMSQGTDRHAVECFTYASDEYWQNNGATNRSYVVSLYRDIHGREGGSEGEDYWTWRLETGTSRYDVARLFLDSPEGVSRLMQRVHQIAFGRPATAAEIDYWTTAQLYFPITYEQMVETLLQAPEYLAKSLDRRFLALRRN
jgi:hypothetical protein